jgi:hypothetical protein
MAEVVDHAQEADVHQEDSLEVDHQVEEVLVIDQKENADLQVIENLLVKEEVLVLIVDLQVLEIENQEVSEENQNIKSSKLVKQRICKIRYGN